ncbi:hypothetical protein S245_020205, partial [Arachis hypogaea]
IKVVVSALSNTRGLNWPSSFKKQRHRTGDLDLLDWLKAILMAGNVSIVTGENIKPSYGGDEEAFLRKVITPFYRVIDTEAKRSRNGTAPHSVWCNYDDLNEYFCWMTLNLRRVSMRSGNLEI